MSFCKKQTKILTINQPFRSTVNRGKMKNIIIEKGEIYEFLPELQGGYYSPNGWHHYKRAGKLVYNIDESGEKFYNKVTEEEIKNNKNESKKLAWH